MLHRSPKVGNHAPLDCARAETAHETAFSERIARRSPNRFEPANRRDSQLHQLLESTALTLFRFWSIQVHGDDPWPATDRSR